jgi:hypothetical protein
MEALPSAFVRVVIVSGRRHVPPIAAQRVLARNLLRAQLISGFKMRRQMYRAQSTL